MLSESALDPALIEAYKATDFKVHAQPPFVLKIGVTSPQLVHLLRQQGHTCAAFVTACNPYSEDVGEVENATLQRKLARELTSRGLTFLPGLGQDSQGQWPGEASFLVLGLGLPEASELGRQFEQNAVVWCGDDAVPNLVLLR